MNKKYNNYIFKSNKKTYIITFTFSDLFYVYRIEMKNNIYIIFYFIYLFHQFYLLYIDNSNYNYNYSF